MTARIEILNPDEVEYVLAGGDRGVMLRALGFALKWLAAGYLFRLGWALWNY